LKDDTIIHGHRFVLASASRLFRKIFGVDKDAFVPSGLVKKATKKATKKKAKTSSSKKKGKKAKKEKKSPKAAAPKSVEAAVASLDIDDDVPEAFLCPISQELMVCCCFLPLP